MRSGRAAVVVLVGCVLLYFFGRSHAGALTYEVSVYPARLLVGGVMALAAHAGDSASGGGNSAQQVKLLEKENALLRLKVAELQQAATETESLRSLLKAREQTKGKTLLCRVIGRSPSYWFHTLTIDAGTRDGVDDRTVLVDGKGVVGRVYRANYFTSNVLVLSGRQEGLFSGVGVKVERTGDLGVVKGDNRRELGLAYLQPEAEVRPGDSVVTSGLGGVFPTGLPVGTVRSVVLDQEGLSKSGVVVPSADLSRLDLLLALLPPEKAK